MLSYRSAMAGLNAVRGVLGVAGLAVSLLCAGHPGGIGRAQAITAGQPSPLKGGHVLFVAEQENVTANQPGMLHLHFKVDPGFHINSHTPKSEMLIPTKIAVLDLAGVEVSDVEFPNGTPYSFAFEPKTKLDVYTGEFTLTAHIKAKPGLYIMKAALHYQACDQAACYPPKTLNIESPFTAK